MLDSAFFHGIVQVREVSLPERDDTEARWAGRHIAGMAALSTNGFVSSSGGGGGGHDETGDGNGREQLVSAGSGTTLEVGKQASARG